METRVSRSSSVSDTTFNLLIKDRWLATLLGRKPKWPAKRLEFMRYCVNWFAKEFNWENRGVVIQLRPFRLLLGCIGTCETPFEDLNRPWSYIEMAVDVDAEDFFEILVHELIHANQYFSGKLRAIREDGKQFLLWNDSYVFDFEYPNSPWEMEAYAQQGKYLDRIYADYEEEILGI